MNPANNFQIQSKSCARANLPDSVENPIRPIFLSTFACDLSLKRLQSRVFRVKLQCTCRIEVHITVYKIGRLITNIFSTDQEIKAHIGAFQLIAGTKGNITKQEALFIDNLIKAYDRRFLYDLSGNY
jgi:hypothetical protein